MSAFTAHLKLATAMLAVLPLTGRNIELDEIVQVGRIQFSEDVAIAGVIELRALPLQDVPPRA